MVEGFAIIFLGDASTKSLKGSCRVKAHPGVGDGDLVGLGQPTRRAWDVGSLLLWGFRANYRYSGRVNT